MSIAELVMGVGAIVLAIIAFEFGYWVRGFEAPAEEHRRMIMLRERSGALAASPEMADRMNFKQEVNGC